MAFAPNSKARLTVKDLDRFAGTTLFDKLGRAVCAAGVLPRKELYEAWETAKRVRRLFRGGRVVDLAGGHGLLAHIMLLLDDTSPYAIVVDPAIPPSAQKLHAAIVSVLKNPEIQQRFAQIGFEIVGDTPEQFAAALKSEGDAIGAVIRKAGIKPDA